MAVPTIAPTGVERTFAEDDIIVSKGDNGDCAYKILSGSVEVFAEEGSRSISLATLREGQIFGELSVLTGGSYSASVRAAENCELLLITSEGLNTMLDSADPILKEMVHMLIERLKSTNEALIKSETREFMDIALL